MKALIKVGYDCNDRCVFCHSDESRGVRASAAEVDRKIDRAAELGHDMVVFSGGEPTIRPELLRWARRARLEGLGLGLVTNGRALARAELTEALWDLGLRYAYVSLHGGSAAVHDPIARADAFEESWAGIERLSGLGVDLTVNCVVSRLNMDALREWVDLVSSLPAARGKLSMTEAKGGASAAFDEIVPSVADAAAAVMDAVRYAESLEGGPALLHDGFPLCLLPGLEERFDDLWTHGFATMAEVWEDDLHPIDDANKLHPDRCADCGLRGPCGGLYRGYFSRRGAKELRPRIAPRSNSFNLVPDKVLAWRRGQSCPIRGATTPYDRSRTLFLRNGERMTLLRTNTRDFSTEELHAAKALHGQIYIDASDKTAPDDFSRDLLKAVRLDACERCPDLAVCAACYKVSPGDPFTRDDEAVRRVLGGLTGDVLDVGCGEGRYADLFAPAAVEGRIDYQGVDPDAASLERLRVRWPGARLMCRRAEDLDPRPRSVDHVLLLRSYNHLADPRGVIERLVEAIRPKGTLLIVDNVAFGLIRRREQARRAEHGPSGLEHYRNHSAAEAAKLLEGLPLGSLEVKDVAADTSNQWLLHYERL